MRRRLALLLSTMLVAGLVTIAPASADDHGDDGGTYLALGDSVAAGTQQPAPFTDNGYTNLLFEKLEKKYDLDTFVNLACPGDDTAEMLDGDASDGSVCYGTAPPIPFGAPSQLDAAVAYLLANPGEVELITITIGANDLLACSPAFDAACVAAQLGQVIANLPVILETLQAVAPGVPIVGMNYYQPNLAFWLVTPEPGQDAFMTGALGLTSIGNDVIEGVYGAFGIPVIDVAEAFKTFETNGKTPKNVKETCKLTLMCEKVKGDYVLSDYDPVEPGPQTDIHPSNKGYKKIAKAFEKTIKDLDLLG